MCHIDHAGTSEQGHVRSRNEDYIAAEVPSDPNIRRRLGSLFLVADGVGGSGAGDVASREAVEMLMRTYYDSRHSPKRALHDAFQRANTHIYDLGLKSGRFRMETTMAALAVTGNAAFIAHVGDTRLYRVRARDTAQAEPLTRDHSEVMELVRMKILPPEGARHHPRRHIITRSVGNDLTLRVPQKVEQLERGDIFVLCTDGVWEPVRDEEIARIVSANAPEEACRQIIALGLERQSTDNLSVQVIRILQVAQENAETAPNQVPWWQRIIGEKK